ncbi:hypothetical protein [Streptomyces sp. NPDC093544]|uniref:hypothetical protein n=1 Tax=Streptomyces sp. NPDC093544 TaxID=3155200 RepID=UPI00343C599F
MADTLGVAEGEGLRRGDADGEGELLGVRDGDPEAMGVTAAIRRSAAGAPLVPDGDQML